MKKLIQISICLMILILNMHTVKAMNYQAQIQDHYYESFQEAIKDILDEKQKGPIYLLDEPLTSFDPVAAYEVKERIRELKSQAIVIFSTHILELAKELCDEIVLLHDQKLEVLGNDKLQSQDFEKEIVTILSEEHGNDTLS